MMYSDRSVNCHLFAVIYFSQTHKFLKTLDNQFDVWVIDFHHYGDAYAGTQKMLDCAHLNSSTLGRYIQIFFLITKME